MDKFNDEKRRELLNAYPCTLGIISIILLVNLFAISEDSLRTAAIVDFVFLFIIPIVFILGYLDFKNFAPMSKRRELIYDGLGVLAYWIALIHFNVQNYTFLSDYTDESTYIIWVSIFAALYVAIGIVCLLLTFLNFHNRKRQLLYFYIVAFANLIVNIMLTASNYDTAITLFWAPLLLMNISYPITADTGLTMLTLAVFVEICIFLFQGFKERKKKLYTESSMYNKKMMQLSISAFVFILVYIIVLPIISAVASVNTDYYTTYSYVYMGFEIAASVGLFVVGVITCFEVKKSDKYGQIYLKMGVAMIIYALTYVIMDFIPITSIITSDNVIRAQVVSDIYRSVIKMIGLIAYILYITLNKKLKAQEKVLDDEYLERTSTEHYSI